MITLDQSSQPMDCIISRITKSELNILFFSILLAVWQQTLWSFITLGAQSEKLSHYYALSSELSVSEGPV